MGTVQSCFVELDTLRYQVVQVIGSFYIHIWTTAPTLHVLLDEDGQCIRVLHLDVALWLGALQLEFANQKHHVVVAMRPNQNDGLLQASTRRGVLQRYRNLSDQGREYALTTMSTECRAFFTGFGKQCCHVFCHFGVRGQRFRLETWCKVRVLRQLQVEDIVCASPSGLRRVSVLLRRMEPESQGISLQKLRRRHRAEITTAST